MRIHLSHSQADPDLRFRPIAKRRRLELATSFATHAKEPDLAIPPGYPYVEPHWLYTPMNTEGMGSEWERSEQRIAAEIFGREAELIVNWGYLNAEIGVRRILGFVDVARYHFEQPISLLIGKAVAPADCTHCLKHCSWSTDHCCCRPRPDGESRSPCGHDCMWCQLYPRDTGPLQSGLARPLMQMVYA